MTSINWLYVIYKITRLTSSHLRHYRNENNVTWWMNELEFPQSQYLIPHGPAVLPIIEDSLAAGEETGLEVVVVVVVVLRVVVLGVV